ncbi:hypothetical protein SUT007_10000 [Streptococcus parasuis]|nr:hypothetical protein SUT007_10000 [Streptococcus parasuis]
MLSLTFTFLTEYLKKHLGTKVIEVLFFFFLMIRRQPRSTRALSSAASDVYKRQGIEKEVVNDEIRSIFYNVIYYYIISNFNLYCLG